MQNRRKFIRNSAGLVAGGFAIPSFAKSFFIPSYPPPGIQLFTFFDVIDADVEGTLKRIAKIGYVEIESAFSKKGGYYGYSIKEFAALVKNVGTCLEVASCTRSAFQNGARYENARGCRRETTQPWKGPKPAG
ncbi:MAG: hypothetical protein WDM78_12180 [Puia sp.]